MQNAETIQEIIREKGRRRSPLKRAYGLLYNPDLYLAAYGKLYRNKGATTPGVTGETVDGMSLDKIKAIIELIRYERYRWSPAKRVYIPKANGKKRPLGLPPWSDKLLQEVLRMILEAYYEPRFSDLSHGFRPERGCHTALREIYEQWKGTCWFIEGDIRGCFDNIDHKILLDILREDIQDERLLRLLSTMLEAGYMEDWVYGKTLSGCPQGGVISPILSNIYLHKLDEFVEKQLLPSWNKGEKRKTYAPHNRLKGRIRYYRKKGNRAMARKLRKVAKTLPTIDPTDPDYRRLRYVRYADDFLLGFCGPKSEAEQIKRELGDFLRRTLKLEMSEAKTLVTHAKTEKARFLGYEVCALMANHFRGRDGRRTINGQIGLRVPREVVERKSKPYMQRGKPVHRAEMINDSDYQIIEIFQSEYRGLVNYWRLAYNLSDMGKLRWIMQQSLVKTLAAKHKTTKTKIYKKYRAKVTVNGRKYKALQVTVTRQGKEPLIATWGGISLARDTKATINDRPKRLWNSRTELVQRMLANECEWCGSRENVQVHHIRGLRDLKQYRSREVPAWKLLMSARRRKTMVVCRECHEDIEHGLPMRNKPSGIGFMHNPRGGVRKRSRTEITVSRAVCAE